MADEDQRSGAEDSQIVEERRAKLAGLRQQGVAFPNNFERRDLAEDLHRRHEKSGNAELEAEAIAAAVAGRMMLKRVMG